MELRTFLREKFDRKSYIEFLSERFYGFEANVNDEEFLGKVKLDDKREVGFFVFLVEENKDIENTRVGFHKELKKYADEHQLDGAIGAFYHPAQRAWRLSFIRFSYDDNHKKQVTNQKRFTFLLGNTKIKTAFEQLKNLKYPKIIELEKAFSVEGVTKEFYKGLVREYEKLLNEYLTYPSNDDNSKKEFAIRLIGRILFIKFLNKKSLVPDTVFELCDGYYHDKLEPLFFEQLNTPKGERKPEFANDSVPFLNGGLFEPLGLDYYEYSGVSNQFINMLKIDDRFFIELYEHLNQYNFTIDENSIDDSDLSIDPEMLGRIFENLLAEINPETSQNARKATGSYYTPREIVEYMVSSSLLEYLKTKTDSDEEVLKTIIFKNLEPQHDYDKAKVLSAIFELKILDPACGSGAFPMGLLQKIVKILNLIDEDATIWFGLQSKEFKEAHKNRNKDYIRKLSIIKNTIYGIDIQPIAIEISKLRFFLSLIVDEEGEPEPLPNLEFKFVCANSLLPFPFAKQKMQQTTIFDNTDNLNEIYDEIKSVRERYFESASSNKKLLKNEYKEAQKRLLEEIIALGNGDMSLVSYDPFDPLSVAPFFDAKFMFDLEDGFDIVIGNPPYIMEAENKSAFDGLKESQCYQGKTDIWHIFTCIGINLLKNHGLITYIAKNQWLNSSAASKMRKTIYEKTSILEIVDFKANMVFENVGQQTMIFLLKKENKNSVHDIRYKFYPKILQRMEILHLLESSNPNNDFQIAYKVLPKLYDEKANLTFSDYKFESILQKIEEKQNFEFDEKKEIIQGIIGGPDEAFTVKNEDVTNFNDDEKTYLKILHTNTGKYYTNESNKYIFYISKKNFDDKNIDDFPNIKAKLEPYKNQLENRRETLSGQKKWYQIWWERDESFFKEGSKIVFASRTTGSNFTFTNDSFYGSRNLFFIKSDRVNLKYITALLNSKLMYFYMHEKLKHTGDLLQIDKNQFMKIPLYKIQNVKSFEILVDYVIFLKQQENKEYITSFFESVIDVAVYELYFPDELHSHNYGVLEILENEAFPTDITMETIESIYQKWSDRDHKIAYNVHFIDSLETIKIIEGKVK